MVRLTSFESLYSKKYFVVTTGFPSYIERNVYACP